MDDPHRWKRSRYAALAAVLAVHAALLAAFLNSANTFFVTLPAKSPLELLMLPRNEPRPESAPPTSAASPHSQTRLRPIPSTHSSDALTVVPTPDGNAAGNAIDWAQEAHDVAASFAKTGKTDGSSEKPASTSPFAQPPAHYKGEQIPTADGRFMVFVSKNCYQLSKEITHITNATNTGKAIQIYCNRPSKTPRGDLFKELPSYKKYHPDE